MRKRSVATSRSPAEEEESSPRSAPPKDPTICCTSPDNGDPVDTEQKKFPTNPMSICRGIYVFITILRIATSIFYVAGIYWRVTLLHNGSECEMTYSRPNFVEISTPFASPSPISNGYKLFKFVDGRDPRYQRLLKESKDGTRDALQHCPAHNASIVLYIPGHWGSHTQARSVGAHGTQWTGAREDVRAGQSALRSGQWTGVTDRIEHFVYEVYAVDFLEQGAAWHGRFLEAQSKYVAVVIPFLAEACNVKEIFLVAHSMGGYVARLAWLRYPQVRTFVPNILTLASPHQNALYGFDGSIAHQHQLILLAGKPLQSASYEEDSSPLLISFSGGLRDEMIAPYACDLQDSGDTYLAASLMKTTFGMDHRAIVWCHGVLSHVRKVIWTLSQEQNKSHDLRAKAVQDMLGSASYTEDLVDSKTKIVKDFGFVKALAMEASMVYNLPILFGTFTIFSAICCTTELLSPIVVLLGAYSKVSFGSYLILAVVATAIHSILSFLLRSVSRKFPGCQKVAVVLFGVVLVAVLTILTTTQGWSLIGIIQASVFLVGIQMVYIGCFWIVQHNPSNTPLMIMIFVTTPCILAGSCILAVWDRSIDAVSWYLWARTVLPALALCYVRKAAPSGLSPYTQERGRVSKFELLRMSLLMLAIFWAGIDLVSGGKAHRAGFVVCSVIFFECTRSL